jgi:peptidoglycan/LPS O-acetylase OafA/YrhL
MDSPKRTHIPVIDTLRGIAACAVCVFHFVCKTKDFIGNSTITGLFSFGNYGVHMFFVISGMVIPLSMIKGNYIYKRWPRFLWKRFLRIEPPYLVAVVLGTAYLLLRNHIPGTVPGDSSPSILTILLHVGYLIPFHTGSQWINPVFWTLAVEFQYYLLLSLLFPLALQKALLPRVLFYALLLGACFLPCPQSFLPVWLPLFLLGIVYILLWSDRINAAEYWLVSIPALCLVFWKIDPACACTAVLTLSAVHFAPAFRNVFTKFFGDISYSIYLIHTIVGGAFINYLSHHTHIAWQKGLLVIGGMLLSIASAYLLNRFIEKPSQELSARIKY